MGGGLAGPQFLRLGVLGIVVLIYLQYIFPADDDQCLISVHPQDFIHRHQLSAAHAAGLSVLWGVVGDPPSPQLLGLAGDTDTGLAGAVRDKLSGESIRTAQKQLDITVAQDLLPLIIGVAVLKAREILKHAR